VAPNMFLQFFGVAILASVRILIFKKGLITNNRPRIITSKLVF